MKNYPEERAKRLWLARVSAALSRAKHATNGRSVADAIDAALAEANAIATAHEPRA